MNSLRQMLIGILAAGIAGLAFAPNLAAECAPGSDCAGPSPDKSAKALYEQGRALEASGTMQEAIRIYRRAARAGSGEAAYRLGEIFEKNAQSVRSQDSSESVMWFELARKLGVPAAQPSPAVTGRDLADRSLAMMQLQAQIKKGTEEYQTGPRKRFIGANEREYRFAQYEADWRARIERVGTSNYPEEARGKLYGTLRLTVTIRPDGNIDSIELDRSSGIKVLDEAAFRIVRIAAPFAAFPPDIRRDTDLLVITRTWTFAQGDKIWSEWSDAPADRGGVAR